MSEAISYLPGYNVRVVLVIQTPAQLREVYGIHNTEVMLKSLAARIVFAPKDAIDAREISDELGFTTVRVKSVSQPLRAIFDAKGRTGRSQTVSLQRRALLLPQEIKELGRDEAIVFYEGLHPIRCRKLRYHDDPRFKSRLLPPPSEPTPKEELDVSAADASKTLVVSTDTALDPNEIAVAATTPPQEPSVAYRDATAADIQNLDALTPDDFEANPLLTSFPVQEGPLSEPQLRGVVRSFFDSVQISDR